MDIPSEIIALQNKLIKKTASLSDFKVNNDRNKYIIQLRILIQNIAYLYSIGDIVGATTFIEFTQKTYV
jgi:hypothetical protein